MNLENETGLLLRTEVVKLTEVINFVIFRHAIFYNCFLAFDRCGIL